MIEMHFLIGRKVLFEMIQELHKLSAAVSLLVGAEDMKVAIPASH